MHRRKKRRPRIYPCPGCGGGPAACLRDAKSPFSDGCAHTLMSGSGDPSEVMVRDVMSARLVTVPGDTTALQVAKMMEQGNIGAVLVKDGGGPVGIITDRDYAVRIAVSGIPLDVPVGSVASKPLITVGPGDSIVSAAKIMREKRIRKLAVSDGGRIVGIITSTNIVNRVSEW